MKLTIFAISSLFLRFWSSRFQVFLLKHMRDELDTILSSVPLALLRAVISAAAHHLIHELAFIHCNFMLGNDQYSIQRYGWSTEVLKFTCPSKIEFCFTCALAMTNDCAGKTEETTRVDQVDSWTSVDGNQPQTTGPAENWYEALMLQSSLVLRTTEVLAKPTEHVLWVRHMR